MDPEANLAEQRKLAAEILSDYDKGHVDPDSNVVRLAELVQALDEWLSKGGFTPKDWVAKS